MTRLVMMIGSGEVGPGTEWRERVEEGCARDGVKGAGRGGECDVGIA